MVLGLDRSKIPRVPDPNLNQGFSRELKWYYLSHFEFLPFPAQMAFQFYILRNSNSTAIFFRSNMQPFLNKS